MKKIIKKLNLVIIITVLVLLPIFSLSAEEVVKYDPNNDIRYSVNTTGGPSELLIAVAQFALGAIGAICVGFIIYAGFMYALARGEEGKIKKAKDIILYSSIGLAVTLGAYAIAQAIFNLL